MFDRVQPTSPRVLAAVAVGGMLGAGGRWSVGWLAERWSDPHPGAWPWATLIVNLVGSLAIGVAAVRIARDSMWWAFAVTGVLGGFTTYSAFAVEIDRLADAGRSGLAATYALVTIAGGVAAVLIGEAGAARREHAT